MNILKKKIILLLLGLITCLSFSFTFRTTRGALSQDWIAIEDFKNDHPEGLVIDSSGNIYVAGYMDNLNSTTTEEIETDIFLLKCDSLGNKQWSRTYDVNKIELCYDLVLDSQNNVYLVGFTELDGDSVLLIKYSSSGHLQWNRTWGKYAEGTSIKIDAVDNIFVCGNMKNEDDIFLQKYDISGNLIWNRTWETPERYAATSMALDSSSNIFIGGITFVSETIPAIHNIFLVKYNSLGVFQWNLTCQTPKREYCYDIIVDSLDNIYILGRIIYELPLNSEIRLRKYDNTGNLIWNATWGNSEAVNTGDGLAIDASDNIYITGGTSGDVLVLKYDSTGDLKWNYTQVSLDNGKGSAIKIDSSENIYICGTTRGISYYFDAFLLKLSKASDQPFIPGYNLPIVTLSVFGIGIAFYVKKRKSFS